MIDLKKRITPGLDRVFDFRTAGMVPPNRVIFGLGAAEHIGVEAAKLHPKGKALIASDGNLKKLGILDQIMGLVSTGGSTVAVFTEIEAEPRVETAEALHAQCLKSEFSILIGMGGGSVMDVTKLVAQSAGRKRSPRDYLEGKVKPEGRGLPLILVPTTAGTGSEVSPNLVIKLGDKKHALSDPYYYPDIAIIDPLLTASMPPLITASTGIDAMSHAIEGMMHKNANPFSDSLALTAIEMAGRYLRRAVANGEDLEARYYMSLASTIGMMGMAMAGGLYAHSACFVLGHYKPTSHGVGVALGLPYIMSFNLPTVISKLARMATALGMPTWMYSELEAAKKAVQAVADLMRDIGLPLTLEEYGIKEGDLEKMAEMMITLYPRPMNARPMGKQDSLQYWRNMWKGTL
jgi:alcohol dehydrogenase class IV